MKEFLYSGRSVQGLKKLEPKKSTYGKEYVYATEDYVIAAVFTRVGEGSICWRLSFLDDGTISLQELIPNAFKCMYDHPISIYKVSSENFKIEDIPSVMNEYESEVEVDVIEEEKYDSGLILINKLQKENRIKLISYDKDFDCTYLIKKQMKYYEDINVEITKNSFNNIIFYHPNLLPIIKNKGFNYTQEEITNIYINKINKLRDNNFEDYVKSALLVLSNYDKELYDKVVSKLNKNIL